MSKGPDLRLGALWRFATAITVFNIVGHLYLGFEQAWAYPFVALATAYATEMVLEILESRGYGRKPRFLGVGFKGFIEFLLPAHITAMAISMLLYSNKSLLPIAFAAAAGIASKYLFRIQVEGRFRHFYNPSNFGIALTLVTFHWVGIAPPYMFTENLLTTGDLVLPAIILCSGTFLNTRFTRRIPLIVAWLATFALQALLRSTFFGTPLTAPFLPMTGMAFLLFTFYMVSDPSTTPSKPLSQVLFGAGVAATYGLLLVDHIVFTLFFALSIVCTVRGIALYAGEVLRQRREAAALQPASAPVPSMPATARSGFAGDSPAV